MTVLNYAKLELSVTLRAILRICKRMLETYYRNPIRGNVTLTSEKGTLKLFGNIWKQSPRKVYNQSALLSSGSHRLGELCSEKVHSPANAAHTVSVTLTGTNQQTSPHTVHHVIATALLQCYLSPVSVGSAPYLSRLPLCEDERRAEWVLSQRYDLHYPKKKEMNSQTSQRTWLFVKQWKKKKKE